MLSRQESRAEEKMVGVDVETTLQVSQNDQKTLKRLGLVQVSDVTGRIAVFQVHKFCSHDDNLLRGIWMASQFLLQRVNVFRLDSIRNFWRWVVH